MCRKTQIYGAKHFDSQHLHNQTKCSEILLNGGFQKAYFYLPDTFYFQVIAN